PGAFLNLSVTGTPINGSTPALGPNTVFDVVGNLTFEVDPAQLTANPVPEPTSLAVVGMGTVSLLVARRRVKA
ncbi:MAG TPA: PEP-CTERM sorting domain-containing protein, partial [Verrucomicrobiae bacterium]|nr:PEP-CTERM sorting domain-containing protein [Verrucomicrobiae bacterium]